MYWMLYECIFRNPIMLLYDTQYGSNNPDDFWVTDLNSEIYEIKMLITVIIR